MSQPSKEARLLRRALPLLQEQRDVLIDSNTYNGPDGKPLMDTLTDPDAVEDVRVLRELIAEIEACLDTPAGKLALDAPLSPDAWALASMKEDLACGDLHCEEQPPCGGLARKLVWLDGTLYALCDFHAKHAIDNRGAKEVE